MLAFSFSNTSFSSALHLNFCIFMGQRASFRKGAVSDAYVGINFDKNRVKPRKLLTASFDSGWLLSITALIFSGFGFNLSFVNLSPKSSISSTPNCHLSGLNEIQKCASLCRTASNVVLCSTMFLPPSRISSRWLRHLGMSPNIL